MGNPNKNQHLPPTSHHNQSLAIVHFLVCRAKNQKNLLDSSILLFIYTWKYSIFNSYTFGNTPFICLDFENISLCFSYDGKMINYSELWEENANSDFNSPSL